MAMMKNIQEFIKELQKYKGNLVFNPWQDYDPTYDIGPEAPKIRSSNLERYLELRENAKYLFIAEGIGYQGGHFSGIAMTSERILLGKHKAIPAKVVLGDWEYKRTSNSECPLLNAKQKEGGFNEPTDTVMWGELAKNSLSPLEAVLWNIFPFHPYKKTGLLTNRTPVKEELDIGIVYAKMLMEMIPNMKIVAIGQKSAVTLREYGIECSSVRHPANGGATQFKNEVDKILSIEK